jgi:Flp pilus assembly pilin Flp
MNAFWHRARKGLVRLFSEDTGQDLVEYALLTAIVALAALVAIPTATELGNIYRAWNTNVNDLWEPPPPSGG